MTSLYWLDYSSIIYLTNNIQGGVYVGLSPQVDLFCSWPSSTFLFVPPLTGTLSKSCFLCIVTCFLFVVLALVFSSCFSGLVFVLSSVQIMFNDHGHWKVSMMFPQGGNGLDILRSSDLFFFLHSSLFIAYSCCIHPGLQHLYL